VFNVHLYYGLKIVYFYFSIMHRISLNQFELDFIILILYGRFYKNGNETYKYYISLGWVRYHQIFRF